MKLDWFHYKKYQQKRNIMWLFGTIFVFVIMILFVSHIANSLKSKPSLPLDLRINLAFTNITNHLICTNGISYPDFIVRGDSLQCYVLTENKPNDTNYKITFERGFLEAQQSYIPWNYTAYPYIEINETFYKSEYFTMPIPDTQIFGLLIIQKDTISPSPVLIRTLSETDVKQTEINSMLLLITSIIALLGIFPASKVIRDFWNYRTK